MARPGGPPPPAERPADCPKDAAYIKTVGTGGTTGLPGSPPFPIVFEGGDGDDRLTVKGGPGKGIVFDGGKGNDTMTIGGDPVGALADRVGPTGTLFLATLAIVFAAIVLIVWRALAREPRR